MDDTWGLPQAYQHVIMIALAVMVAALLLLGWILLKQDASLLKRIYKHYRVRGFFGVPVIVLSVIFVITSTLLLEIVEDRLMNAPLLVDIDQRITHLFFGVRTPTLMYAWYIVTLLADVRVVVTAMALLTALLIRERQKIFLLPLWISFLCANGTTMLGKLLFQRMRPDDVLRAVVEDTFAFPSGHATAAVALYGSIAYLIIRTNRRWSVRIGSLVGAGLIVLLIDMSRLFLGVHFVSDVIAGNLVGLATLVFAICMTEWLLWERQHPVRELALKKIFLGGIMLSMVIAGLMVTNPTPFITPIP